MTQLLTPALGIDNTKVSANTGVLCTWPAAGTRKK